MMAKIKSYYINIITVILLLVGSQCIAEEKGQESFTFGIVPQQAASKLAELWMPLLDEVNRKSGVNLIFKTAPNIPKFEARLGRGLYDFAYMNPYHYTVFHDKVGYEATIKELKKRIVGIVVVNKNSDIKDIKDLSGMSMAFPAPAAFAATMLPLASFKSMGIEVKPVFVNSHDSVYRTVAGNIYSAGGGIQRTLKNIDPIIKQDLRILWKTKKYTPHAIAHHPRIKPETVAKIQQAILLLNDSNAGKKILQALNFKGFETAENADWDDVRDLNVDLLKTEH